MIEKQDKYTSYKVSLLAKSFGCEIATNYFWFKDGTFHENMVFDTSKNEKLIDKCAVAIPLLDLIEWFIERGVYISHYYLPNPTETINFVPRIDTKSSTWNSFDSFRNESFLSLRKCYDVAFIRAFEILEDSLIVKTKEDKEIFLNEIVNPSDANTALKKGMENYSAPWKEKVFKTQNGQI